MPLVLPILNGVSDVQLENLLTYNFLYISKILRSIVQHIYRQILDSSKLHSQNLQKGYNINLTWYHMRREN